MNTSLAIKDSKGNRAIPILWFGDLEAYRKSQTKILTVGINPSDVEFKVKKTDKNFDLDYRFPGSTSINFNNPPHNTYTQVLSNYFRKNPYRSWFDRNEAALNGLGASYYDGEIRALHIDIRTPIATLKKWRALTKNEKSAFGAYIQIFNDLVEELQPDIMIMPLGEEHIKKNMPNHNIIFSTRCTQGLQFCQITLQSGKDCILIKAQNSNIGTYRPVFPKINDIYNGFHSIKPILKSNGINLP